MTDKPPGQFAPVPKNRNVVMLCIELKIVHFFFLAVSTILLCYHFLMIIDYHCLLALIRPPPRAQALLMPTQHNFCRQTSHLPDLAPTLLGLEGCGQSSCYLNASRPNAVTASLEESAKALGPFSRCPLQEDLCLR